MHPTLRKAAILVASLDTTSADALLDEMEPEEAARVRRAVLELGDIDPTEQQQIMSDFLCRQPRVARVDAPAVELDPSLAAKLGSLRAADETASRGRAAAATFAFLQPLETAELARILVREHPQTIAIVMSHLPPARAADVLRRLPPSLQSETLMRVARLGRLSPDVVQDLEQALRAVLEDRPELEPVASHGVAAIGAILQAASGAERQTLLADLSRQDPALAQHFGHRFPSSVAPAVETREQVPGTPAIDRGPRSGDRPVPAEASAPLVRPPALLFADLEQLEDAALAQVLHQSSPATAILALAGASPQFVERILGQLPAREATQLQRKMQQLGPLRLDDIERAQLRLADVAQQLMAQGTIMPPPVARFAVAA
jgi:flagellar motor switch protein FliG